MNGLEKEKRLRNGKYVLPGEPVPLARARMGSGRMYDTQKQLKLVGGITLQAQHGSLPLFSGPLHLHIDFYLATPQKNATKLYNTFHVYKPDISNLIKYVEDVATGIIYRDDCLIAMLTAYKRYDANPRTEFTIREVGRL